MQTRWVVAITLVLYLCAILGLTVYAPFFAVWLYLTSVCFIIIIILIEKRR
jgi:hypothetical protein